MIAEKDQEMVILKESFKKLRGEYARIVCLPRG